MQDNECEFKLSIIRWFVTILPLWLVFADYFTLQAYLLRFYEPSLEYINAGWKYWYLTLLTGSLLALSLNLLILRYKRTVGVQRALKVVAPFLFLSALIPLYKNSQGYDSNNGNNFFYYPFFIVLVLTVIFHLYLSFFKKDKIL